jgi:hypothetical protein
MHAIRQNNPLRSRPGSVFLFALILLLPSVVAAQDARPWLAPADAKKVKNPVPMTGETLSASAPIYEQNCLRCHGVTGAANGPDAQVLPKAPADFTDTKILKKATEASYSGKSLMGETPCRPMRNCRISSGGNW